MKDKNIFVAGHKGMLGSSLIDKLKRSGCKNLITKSKKDLNLLNQKDVDDFFKKENIDYVILCAAKVGGILANDTYKGDFIYENLQISTNVIKSSKTHKVSKLINLGSSCIYPKNCKIPIKEELLLTGELEKTNEPYAIAKIAALKMCEFFHEQYKSNFYSLMPCNLYGPRDNFSLNNSHVLPALIKKIHCAMLRGTNEVTVWGSGKPIREFLYVEDAASAIIHCLKYVNANDIYKQNISHINCGSGEEISIKNLAYTIKSVLEYPGDIIFDKSKPDGTLIKTMDNSRLNSIGFNPKYKLRDGIKKTYQWFVNNQYLDC